MKIINYFKGNYYRIFILLSFIICFFYAVVFEPITLQAEGDAGAYIELAKQFLGISEVYIDLSHRQPLYSLCLSPLILLFGEQAFAYPVMCIQFLLIFLSSSMIYKIFENITCSITISFTAGILYLLNLSTIYFGYNILSETLALFLFILLIYYLIKYSKKLSIIIIAILGILSGFLILARYNTIGLPVFILLGISLIHYHYFKYRNLKQFLLRVIVYCISIFFILNFWMLYNHNKHGFYGLIQKNNPRFAYIIYSRLNENIVVDSKYQDVLNIFLLTRQQILENNQQNYQENRKGSLLNYAFFNKVYIYLKGGAHEVGGSQLYNEAKPLLFDYFQLDGDDPKSITKLSILLKPFNNEIKAQTKKYELKQRLSAVIQTFRHSGGILPNSKDVNLNILPTGILLFYRVSFIVIMLFTMISSIIIFLKNIWRIYEYNNYFLLILIILIMYFPISHFLAITPGDANRFKFPSEPIILGLFIYYCFLAITNLKYKTKKLKYYLYH